MVVTPDGSVPWMVDLFGEDTLSFVLQPNMPRDETYVQIHLCLGKSGICGQRPPQPTLNRIDLAQAGSQGYPGLSGDLPVFSRCLVPAEYRCDRGRYGYLAPGSVSVASGGQYPLSDAATTGHGTLFSSGHGRDLWRNSL